MTFVDSGPFIAKYAQKGQFHQQALDVWKDLAETNEQLVTSNFVLDEAFTLLARRTNYAFAAETARIIYESNLFIILRPDQDDELGAIGFFQKYADQHVSFTDCVSFALMHRQEVTRVFTFDQHFTRAGFVVTP